MPITHTPRRQVVVALWDCEPSDASGLAFSRGDRLLVLETSDPDWWYAQHLTTTQQGYVPSNHVAHEGSLEIYDWYVGAMSRKEAERLLLHQEHERGAFLVRESETAKGAYSLSVRDVGEVEPSADSAVASQSQSQSSSNQSHSSGVTSQQQQQQQQSQPPAPAAGATNAAQAAQVAGVRIKHYRIKAVPYTVSGGTGAAAAGGARTGGGADGGTLTDSSSSSVGAQLLVGFCITSKRTFPSLEQLVLHYKERADGLCCALRSACARPRPLVTDLSQRTKDRWEIPLASLHFKERLGSGQFGEVWRALFTGSAVGPAAAAAAATAAPSAPSASASAGGEHEGSPASSSDGGAPGSSSSRSSRQVAVEVAVKRLRTDAYQTSSYVDDFLKEATIMKRLSHPNLVRLYAVCTKEPPICIVTELMPHGALLSYLREGSGQRLPLPALVDMMAQIAAGMAYLERQKYIHRDLAARNILVGDRNIVKVADFGLARLIRDDEYSARSGAKFPIKWTAPEALDYGRFTHKSDVWSYGIVLYEIITKGVVPYAGMSNSETIAFVRAGGRNAQPPECPNELYDLMLRCWAADDNSRPTFEFLASFLEEYYLSTEPDPNYRPSPPNGPGGLTKAVPPAPPVRGQRRPSEEPVPQPVGVHPQQQLAHRLSAVLSVGPSQSPQKSRKEKQQLPTIIQSNLSAGMFAAASQSQVPLQRQPETMFASSTAAVGVGVPSVQLFGSTPQQQQAMLGAALTGSSSSQQQQLFAMAAVPTSQQQQMQLLQMHQQGSADAAGLRHSCFSAFRSPANPHLSPPRAQGLLK